MIVESTLKSFFDADFADYYDLLCLFKADFKG